jgi:hypothetical protein
MNEEKTQIADGVASELNAELDPNLVEAGDKILIKWHNGLYEDENVFEVVFFRFALGFFESEEAKEAGNFTPLCDVYKKSEKSTQEYISNYGEYISNKIPAWVIIEKKV